MINSFCKAIRSKWYSEDSLELYAGGYKAIIIPGYGSNVIALENKGHNACLLRTPKDPAFFTERPQVYGLPILLPPNRISGGRFEYNGKSYILPINEPKANNHIHGHLYRCPFELMELSSGESQARAVLCYISKSNPKFYHGIQNDFAVTAEFVLSSGGLRNKVSISNESGFPLPLGLGFHTAFNVPFINNTEISEYKILCSVDEHWPMNKSHITSGFVKTDSRVRKSFRECGLHPMGELPAQWSAKPISYGGKQFHGSVIKSLQTGIDLVYEVSEKFKFWVFWNEGGGKNFICMEPQTWIINAPNSGLDDAVSGFTAIKENSTEHYESRIYLRK